jgi:two-component system chemotaxis response regulator CheY
MLKIKCHINFDLSRHICLLFGGSVLDPKKNVIVVDDMSSVRNIVTRTIQGMGFEHIIEAANGNEAFEAILTAIIPVGLIISDWNMPICSGLDFLKRVRTHPATKTIPFMMLTSESEKDLIVGAIKAGVNGYILKPFTPDDLVIRIKAMKV